ncbi:MAG: nitroreductase family protein [Christensenellaceae bacterium]|nr:nitroreductase family protein [Christensenellaceae bacterium]
MNDTLKCIINRYSCRKFGDTQVNMQDLLSIAKAGLASPSGMNRQNWQIIMVTNQEIIKELDEEGLKVLSEFPDKSLYDRILKRGGKLFYGAPALIIIAIKETFPKGAELIDLGIVAQTISLAATSLGVDNCHCGFLAFCFAGSRGNEFKEKLEFPDGYECGMGVLLGYSAERNMPHKPNIDKLTIID